MITIPLFKVIIFDNFYLYLLKNLHFMEAETTNNINNFSYIFWILGGITISCIITLTAKSIKKHTFKNILTQAFLHSSFITLSNNLYKINLYNNHPYHLTPPESIYYKIMVSILCIFICLVLNGSKYYKLFKSF